MAEIRRLPKPVTAVWDWQLHAACRHVDSAFFFHPERERGSARIRREARAKAICQQCPVVAQCRAHALAVREPYGIWGGLSRTDRDRITGPNATSSECCSPTAAQRSPDDAAACAQHPGELDNRRSSMDSSS